MPPSPRRCSTGSCTGPQPSASTAPPAGFTHDRDKAISLTSYFAQLKAIHRWGLAQPQDLSVIHRPVLVANGESDRMVPTKNSFELVRRLPDADLVVYPDAGHGGIFQFHEQFVAEALDFLER
jgi:pimeloyl-ACP methyl ester carboxylesterase